MKNFKMIFFALVLLLATLKADGQSFKTKPYAKVLSDQQATMGRKGDVGAREAKDPTANAATSLVVAAAPPEEDDDSNPTFGQYGNDPSKNNNHHIYTTGRNPYAPKAKNSP